MPTNQRKGRKYRGSRTHGYGKVGQHRDQGAKPNRKCGRHKHKWSYVIRYFPDYFQKKGFTCPRTLNQRTKTISLRELDEITKQQTTQTIDLDSMGYTKLLATGKLTRPLTIKIASTSKAAITKIKAAGGQIQTETETDAETEEAEEKEEE
jgi:large subunit ribosomal protein L15